MAYDPEGSLFRERVKAAFHLALEGVPPGSLYPGDEAVEREVNSLLGYHARASGFMETPAVFAAAPDQALGAPSRCGPWKLGVEIGHGGMAVVYLAERADGQYRKKAAAKILHSGLIGEEPRRRFVRERQLLADLDHPSIVRLLDGGTLDDGRPFLVEELVEGESICAWAEKRGLNFAERLALFSKVCDAVEYAHRRGVIHRDLKPANILVTSAGEPKLLDFGIARWLEDEQHGETRLRYCTPEYSAPEVLREGRGGPAADVYSLGLVARELLGFNPPSACRRAIGRALAELPERRWPSAAAFGAELERAASGRLARSRLTIGLAALVVTAVLLWYAGGSRPSFPEVRMIREDGASPAYSPDGRQVAYAAFESTGSAYRLFIQDLDSGSIRMFGPARHLSWSPDGRWIAVLMQMDGALIKLSLVDPVSGRERPVAQLASYGSSDFSTEGVLAWTHDSQSVILPDRAGPSDPYALYAIHIQTGARRQLTQPPAGTAGDSSPAASRDGAWLVFARMITNDNHELRAIRLADGAETVLAHDGREINGAAVSWDSRFALWAGRRAGSRHRAIWQIALGKNHASPLPAYSMEGDLLNPVTSAGGLLFRRSADCLNLWRGDRHGSTRKLTPDGECSENGSARFAPDGARIAYHSDVTGDFEIWVADREGARRRQLTSMRGPYTDSPRWSPDGRSIVFTSAAGANRDIFLVAAEGGPVRRLTTEPSEEGRPSWSHDGQWIYFRSNRSGSRQIWKLRADGAGGARQVTYSGAYEAFETHDGGSIFYAGERGKPGVRKLSVADGRQGLLVAPGANEGFWYLGRGAIYYPDLIRTSDVHPVRRLDITTGAEEDIGSIRHPSNGFSGFTMAPDEKSWVWSQLDRSEGGIVLVEGWR